MATSLAPKIARPLYHLLVCGIGNPPPYTNTLHSTGNLLLAHLQEQRPQTFPPFKPSGKEWGRGLMSKSMDPNIRVTLWQSPSVMNNCGATMLLAYKQFWAELGGAKQITASNRNEAEETALLVVVHDELELPPGEVEFKKGASSVKGHNGLKNVRSKMEHAEWLRPRDLQERNKRLNKMDGLKDKWCRIGVGIGRPESRESMDVASYVLAGIDGEMRRRLMGGWEEVEAWLGRLQEQGPHKLSKVERHGKMSYDRN